MRQFLLLLFIFPAAVYANAGEIKYPVSSIPENLKKNAHAIKRLEEVRYEIVDLDEAIYRRKIVYTILDEGGERYAPMVVGYDKLVKVTSMEGALYDANGQLLKRSKNKEIRDYSAIQDISLFDDNRMKVHDFGYRVFPYTVEYEVEIKFSNTFSIPDWQPQEAEYVSVESSSYAFISPSAYSVRFKTFNYKGDPVTVTEKNKKSMTWQVADLPAIKRPYASPVWNELTTGVYFAPSEFEVEGFKGNASTWQEFGKFNFALNEGRDELPDDLIKKIKELTAGIPDDREKVKVLYEYLQKNTRYISIQLGIGGWQPFEASFVAQKGYGDCKALSNFMASMLKAAGIRSFYSLVHAGAGLDDQYLIEDFPSNQFNHIIVCVPLQKDTMWLECTSQDVPAGYMGDFTGNRKALLIAEDGGHLVSTPRYTIRENVLARHISSRIETDGTLNMKVQTKYGGTQQDDLSGLVNHYSKDKVEKFLQEELELSTYNVNSFKYEESKSVLPELNETMDISVNGYATVSGKRIFIVPNIMNRSGRKLEEDQRSVDFVFAFEYRDEDDYEIGIPEGYQPEAMPQDVSVKTRFGTYSCSTRLEGNKILYHRVREQFAGRFPAVDAPELAKFLGEIYKADRSRLVLVKK